MLQYQEQVFALSQSNCDNAKRFILFIAYPNRGSTRILNQYSIGSKFLYYCQIRWNLLNYWNIFNLYLLFLKNWQDWEDFSKFMGPMESMEPMLTEPFPYHTMCLISNLLQINSIVILGDRSHNYKSDFYSPPGCLSLTHWLCK